MKNSEKFYGEIRRYLKNVAEITGEYDTTMSRAEPYKGSEAHKRIEAEATAKRDAALQEAKDSASKAFREIIEDMRQTVRSRKIAAPTQEMINILTVLKMRGDSLSADEIKQAANSMKDCPAAVAVLYDIARDRGLVVGLKGGSMSTNDVMQHIENAERGVYSMFRGDSARYSRIPENLSACLTTWAAFNYTMKIDEWNRQHVVVNEEKITEFCKIIDGEEA